MRYSNYSSAGNNYNGMSRVVYVNIRQESFVRRNHIHIHTSIEWLQACRPAGRLMTQQKHFAQKKCVKCCVIVWRANDAHTFCRHF